MINKELIKARAENYAINVNEYGPIQEAFEDGVKWAEEQLQKDIMILVKHPDSSQEKKDLNQKYLKQELEFKPISN